MMHNRSNEPKDVRKRLRRRWRMLCGWLGLKGNVMPVCERLHAAYSEPWRAYHNLMHVEDCLEVLDRDVEFDLDARLAGIDIEMAIFFHDAVYDVKASDNEERSAQLACSSLASLGASPEFAARVAELIRATDHRQPARDESEKLNCDIDLSILGRDETQYKAYTDAIFREYNVDRQVFAKGRSAFLESMLARQTIFRTDALRARYEQQARKNMADELERWKGELAL
jgi:predicted metal-dependent HD superfamily phosphohydrolase